MVFPTQNGSVPYIAGGIAIGAIIAMFLLALAFKGSVNF